MYSKFYFAVFCKLKSAFGNIFIGFYQLVNSHLETLATKGFFCLPMIPGKLK